MTRKEMTREETGLLRFGPPLGYPNDREADVAIDAFFDDLADAVIRELRLPGANRHILQMSPFHIGLALSSALMRRLKRTGSRNEL